MLSKQKHIHIRADLNIHSVHIEWQSVSEESLCSVMYEEIGKAMSDCEDVMLVAALVCYSALSEKSFFCHWSGTLSYSYIHFLDIQKIIHLN